MTHQLIATISETQIDRVCDAIKADDSELVEIRLDQLWPTPPGDEAVDHLIAIEEAADGRPLLATLRPKRQGGKFEGPEDVRISLLIAAARAGFSHLDLEADQSEMAKIMGVVSKEAKVVLSDHSLADAPSRDRGLNILQAMQDLNSQAQKLAIPCGSFIDELRCLELAYAHAERNGEPIIAPLGGGAELRALLALAGNQSTYGHANRSEPAIASQPSVGQINSVWQHWGLAQDEVGARQGWYAVLGDPVSHSLSPRIHNAALRDCHLPQRYGAFRVPDSIGAARLLATVAPRIGLLGASVTMPLKAHFATATNGDESVQAIGAANCIRWRDEPESTNTDASAFTRLIRGDKVAVLGSGGAARAAIWAAQQRSLDVVMISRESPRTTSAIADLKVEHVEWSKRNEVRADCWIQATSIGAGQEAPLQSSSLDGATQLIELVYGVEPTRLQEMAQASGLDVIEGKQFLIEQAIDAFRYWTGAEADAKIMEAACE